MRVAGIVKDSVVNGDGIRDVIFLQGCNRRCEDCHNPQTWDTNGGESMSIEAILAELSESYNQVTISGGEPLLQFLGVVRLVELLKERQGKTCWLYTGFKFEEVDLESWIALCRAGVRVVVDGAFEKDKKDIKLQFRGSSNQRIIDLAKTLDNYTMCLWEGNNE